MDSINSEDTDVTDRTNVCAARAFSRSPVPSAVSSPPVCSKYLRLLVPSLDLWYA